VKYRKLIRIFVSTNNERYFSRLKKIETMKNVIVKNATWSGDDKSVDFTIDNKRMNVVVGNDNWEEENEEVCKDIIEKELNIVITNELIIE